MRPSFDGPRPFLFGHRGAAGVAPENTLAAFRRGLDDGADVLELDVHATHDGEVVVIHDPTVERTTDGKGAVASLTYADLARLDAGHRFSADGGQSFPWRGQGIRVPRLVDLLQACPDAPLNIEIKQETPSIVGEVVALVRGARAPVVLAAERDVIMQEIRSLAPDLPTSLSVGEVAAFFAALRAGATPPLPSGAVALQIPPEFGTMTLVTRESVAAAHALGREVHVWTINDPTEARRLLALGCDAIMSDFPARMRALVTQARRPP